MKKKILIVVLAFAIVACAGCETSTKEKASKKKDKDKETEKTEVEIEFETVTLDTKIPETEVVEESTKTTEETIVETTQTEETTTAEPEYNKEEVYKTLYEKLEQTTSDEILNFVFDDFDLDGVYEAFAFAGSEEDITGMTTYSGTFYFVNADVVEKVADSSRTDFLDTGSVADFGNRKYFLINNFYTTSDVTDIYTVRDGLYCIEVYSGVGAVYDINGNDFCITLSAYDGMFDRTIDAYIVHSWKPYYFAYSPELDTIIEYTGDIISIEEAASYLPAGVLDEVTAEGYEIENAFIRGNGILNINYYRDDGDSVSYYNLNYDTVNGKYVDAYGMNESNTWQNSNFSGTYYATI